MVINGREIALNIIAELERQPQPKKFLAAFLVGEDPASISFLNQKKKVAEELGVDFRIYRLAMTIDSNGLRKEVLKIAQHKTCGGVIVQLPLPASINAQYVLNAIPREKDVDVLGERALGAFYAGRNQILPPAVGVVEAILSDAKLRMHANAAKMAIVGLGTLVGKPIATWAEGKFKEVFLLDKGSHFNVLKNADVVVCGTGIPDLVKPEMLKNNALVIDFGYGLKDGKPSGDFSAEGGPASGGDAITYTPTPGGTGPILVAKLFENFFTLLRLKD